MRRITERVLALVALALVAPTLLLPIRTWHSHEPHASGAELCAAGGCAAARSQLDRAGGSSAGAPAAHDSRSDKSCPICTAAAGFVATATVDAPLVCGGQSEPALPSPPECFARPVWLAHAARGPPISIAL